jgi:hypothetical protein
MRATTDRYPGMNTLQRLIQRLPLPATLKERAVAFSGDFTFDVLLSIGRLVVLAISGVLINVIISVVRGNEALGVFNRVYAIYMTLSQFNTAGMQF